MTKVKEEQIKFVQLSDVHYDPHYHTSKDDDTNEYCHSVGGKRLLNVPLIKINNINTINTYKMTTNNNYYKKHKKKSFPWGRPGK